jgi:hypothetical protein
LTEFSKPWLQLEPAVKLTWTSKFKDSHPLPWSCVAEEWEDPSPELPGENFVLKIDLDLSDAEIRKRFALALVKLRGGREPIHQKTENLASQLTAIAAQRLYDCKGKDDESVLEFSEFVCGDKEKFTSEQRIHEAAQRYQKLEETFKVGVASSGRFRLKIEPRAYRLRAG